MKFLMKCVVSRKMLVATTLIYCDCDSCHFYKDCLINNNYITHVILLKYAS